MQIQKFTFNPFQENTYVLYNDEKKALIVDPGCIEDYEKKELLEFIETNNLEPVGLINTHCHIDHILGNGWVAERFGLKLQAHKLEEPILAGSPQWGLQYGIVCPPSPKIEVFLKEGDQVQLGSESLEVIFVPGHSPGHIALISRKDKFVVGGDVLFKGSFGRVDLPGGDIKTLVDSIMLKLFNLPDDFTVYAGHMEETTIGQERATNMIYQFT
jgi:glyoxylase-like metal-dependent hydrolase (beta-lactamase superfamily II)